MRNENLFSIVTSKLHLYTSEFKLHEWRLSDKLLIFEHFHEWVMWLKIFCLNNVESFLRGNSVQSVQCLPGHSPNTQDLAPVSWYLCIHLCKNWQDFDKFASLTLLQLDQIEFDEYCIKTFPFGWISFHFLRKILLGKSF